MSSARVAELKAQVAHLSSDRILLWDDRKSQLHRVGRLEAENTQLKDQLAAVRKVSEIIEERCRETIDKQDEEIAFLKKVRAYQEEMRACEKKKHERKLTAAYNTLQRTQADCSELMYNNQLLTAQVEELRQLVDDQSTKIAECEKMISTQQAILAARPPVSSWAPSGMKPKPWSVPAQNARIEQLAADKEELTEQLASMQQQNDELLQQRQQLQDALHEAEVDQWDLSMVSKQVADLGVRNLLLELDLDNARASNQQLQSLVTELQSQLKDLQAQHSNKDQQHQGACDPVAAAQAGLKPVAVPSPGSGVQESQPDEPETPEVSELELSSSSYPSSSQSSRRTSEVCQPGRLESCSSSSSSSSAASGSSTSGAMDRINSLHPLYRYCSWVQGQQQPVMVSVVGRLSPN